jgi:hypothetical protein
MSRDPDRERSRPDYDAPEGDRHGHWTSDTPTSLRRLEREQEQPQEQPEPQEQGREMTSVRHRSSARERPLTRREQAQVRELSRAGLVRTSEENQRRRSGADRRGLQHRGTAPWLPPRQVQDLDDAKGRV